MNEYLPGILSLAIIHLLAVMAPGPDFVMISRSSLIYSRKTGLICAIGLGFGVLVHFIYCALGLGLIISKSILLYSSIKFLGAAYLIYIGFKALTSKAKASNDNKEIPKPHNNLSGMDAFKLGFLTNLLNPKAAVYFLSLFTQFMQPGTPLFIYGVYGTEIIAITILWFAFLALVLSHSHVKRTFNSIQNYIEKAMGAILIALGLKIALD